MGSRVIVPNNARLLYEKKEEKKGVNAFWLSLKKFRAVCNIQP